MGESWNHRVIPLDPETRRRDDEWLAGIRSEFVDVPCDPETCDLTTKRIREWGWWDPRSGAPRSGGDPRDNHHHTAWVDGEPKPRETWCSARCHERREYLLCYDYITGRGGRVGRARRPACRRHAEAFARKYRAAMPS